VKRINIEIASQEINWVPKCVWI